MKVLNHLKLAGIVLLCSSFLISCESNQQIDRAAERHELAFVLIRDEWKVVDAENFDITEIVVARGDTVIWQAPDDSDVYFQFMDEALTGVYTKELSQGESFTVTIGEEAMTGDNPYAVFMFDDRIYATGDSPPRMIVRY